MCDSLNQKGLDNKECPDSWDCAPDQESDPAWDPDADNRPRLRPISIHISWARNCCAFVWLFTPTFFVASLPLLGSVTKGPLQRADQLSRGLSRNESLSNKQSTWWSGRTGRKKVAKNTHREKKHAKGGKNLHTRYQFVRGTIGIYIYALAWLLLSGACRQSKIINTPNFEKWLKKFVAPRHGVLPRAGPRRSRSNCVSLKSTPAPNAKSRVEESVYALMVFQTTRSIINIWRLGKCIRSLPSATAPRPAYALRLATRCDEKQCQDDALFHSMRRHAIGRGRKCRGVTEIWIFAPLFAASK